MDVREKLIELIASAKYICANDYSDHTEDKYIVDTLLDNGVTVPEWISVTERLPEQTDPATAVLGITKQGKCYVVYYYKAAINDEFTGFYDNAVKRAVTHWMPLPEPPKGE